MLQTKKRHFRLMPIKPAHAFQREGEEVIKARENAWGIMFYAWQKIGI